ncbi:MAG: hypothetical protein FWC20_08380 [Oscillospiraceae bacterium]|nr:hypothetical protein [Oscillospiraceae bacterium]
METIGVNTTPPPPNKIRKNPYAEKIKKHGYSITIHYSPEDVAEMTQDTLNKIKTLDMLELSEEEIKALKKYESANKA